jgi:heme-degrading monooxygenase HmoA
MIEQARLTETSMYLEIAAVEIIAEQEGAFETAVGEAAPLFLRAKGCRGVQLQRSVEQPSHYRLVVKWETVEDHMVHFRQSDDFQAWRRLVGKYFASPPVVEHTRQVFKA